jgi:hypothetical protein
MKKTIFATAACLMASSTVTHAGSLLPRLQPLVQATVSGLAAPASAASPGLVQGKEGEPRFGLPSFPDLALSEQLPYIEVPGVPSDQLYWVGHWIDDTVNWDSRRLVDWSTNHAPSAAWDELDIVLGMVGAGDLGGAGNRMAGFVTKVPAPPQPQLPWELGLTPTYDAAWSATIGATFGPPYGY